jgi:SAM-dependent methyltransferase
VTQTAEVNEVSTGLRAVLSHPSIYELWSRLVGGVRARTKIVAEHVRPAPGDEILDLGCGPGELLAHIPADVQYTGVDLNPLYIARARERYGARAVFHVGDASRLALQDHRYDLVLAIAVLHHLDDEQAARLIRDAGALLKQSGRFVSLDAVYTQRQNPIARAIIDRDRGRHVRDAEGYAGLARSTFESVQTVVRHDLLRMPYDHCILECAGVRESPDS